MNIPDLVSGCSLKSPRFFTGLLGLGSSPEAHLGWAGPGIRIFSRPPSLPQHRPQVKLQRTWELDWAGTEVLLEEMSLWLGP